MINALPHFWKRSDYINSFIWNDVARQTYISKVPGGAQEAERYIRSYFSPLAFHLFNRSLPNDWLVFAAPVANEDANGWTLSNAKNLIIDGCELATPT
ncbi:unnamed protein product [Didymodactylos carnosus]|uniref:Uncharacterized protein n=1 Tax=Didymodactylos carnosus TaxID=1234261 RepID=A0A8S2UJX7_9BILA|nr:unnamed protein product [Didymodactylos carnosus]CAF4341995.1 unnamed protein product [Didymodactylos carnosus]